ncbi:amidophosphoribosyltransferase [candidate division WOR-3 bacterium]|nr:amidophosphoribosyltransferase [candidate division WOR-3 bacterium]
MCGILGIIGKDNLIDEIVTGLLTIQHRGQDAAGAITFGGKFNLKKGIGLVRNVFNKKNMARLEGDIAIGHVRYPTIGTYEETEIQPFYINSPYGIALAHNGNVINYRELKTELEKKELRYINSDCDAELILNVLGAQLSRFGKFNVNNLFAAVKKTFDAIQGSYSVISIIGENGLLAFRDAHGIKPLIFGRKENSFAFASESVALDILGYKIINDVLPGEAIFIDRKGNFSRKKLTNSFHSPCIFEWIYFARPDSIIDRISVYEARFRLGKKLAEEIQKQNIKPDIVIPIPDTSRAAALALAEEIAVNYREGLIKNRYIARTFIMSSQSQRISAVRKKLNPIRNVIDGKNILLVDDSIVRGNTSKEIVNLMRIAGARKVYFASYSPPLRYPCLYGIDMQIRNEFIAKEKSIAEIKENIGCDKLVYQTMDALLSSLQIGNKNEFRFFCTACFDGNYPTKVSENKFKEIEKDRIESKRHIQQ